MWAKIGQPRFARKVQGLSLRGVLRMEDFSEENKLAHVTGRMKKQAQNTANP
jgi:hypothetical protein